MRKKDNFCNCIMMDDHQRILLSPAAHLDGVNCFFDFFKIDRKKPDLKFLEEILFHFENFPYENISKIIKLHNNWNSENKIRLPEEVIKDHISHGLGGTCFSLTFFLQSILTQNGFISYPVMADMRSGKNIHCFLIVVLSAVKYLADPGYLLKKTFEINPEKHQTVRHEFSDIELKFDQNNQSYNLFSSNKFETKWRYRFQDKPVPPDKFLRHWLASFGWNSMHRIYLTKMRKEGLFFVRNDFMRKATFEEKNNYNIKKNFHSVIYNMFGIDKELSEQGRSTLRMNLERERASGLWTPKYINNHEDH